MYRSIVIKNFRCFRDLTLGPLERVNLITGKNNVGKTALLEALFLHLGANNPTLPIRVNAIRGLEQFVIDARDIWGWLFFGWNTKDPIHLAGEDTDETTRLLNIRLVEPETTQLIPSNGGEKSRSLSEALTTADRMRDLLLEYRDSRGQTVTARVLITPEGELSARRDGNVTLPLGIYLSTRARSFREDSERFSNLERVGRHEAVLPTLQLLEPRLKRLAVLVTGGVPLVNGDIGIGELIPLPLMGEGMVRLLSILLAIANAPGGIVLVDEIENGLHHSVLLGVWEAIARAARQYDTQLFATTHSWECVQAAHEAFEASGAYDFRLHRLDRIEDDVRAVAYDDKRLAAVLTSDLEVH